ncbi:RteC domain-containing protein [Sunxiuqinia indica]|uniref:RteC domain-containing protein n=1 Tax=Sunxiuqinia indica TaxID=2692584 RepID=UPI00135AA64B|nr:RteC domain-containing protein [Sunxiuqinia indica]
MKSHLKIIEELNNALSKTKEVSVKLPDQMEYAIGHCKIALDDMRKLVVKDGFADKESEIEFFKKLKPEVYSKLLYYREVFDLETKRQDNDKEGTRKYLHKKLDKIMECMVRNDMKVQYYRCNYNHLDEKYFLRDGAEIPLELRDNHHLLDEQFFTWHDHTFSMIRANEMLIDYITGELRKLDSSEDLADTTPVSSLYWTGSKIDVAEIIYALYFAKVINGGKVTIRELAEVFSRFFNLDLTNDVYRYYAEIRQRKINQTKFLDVLRHVLQQKMDEANE